MSLSKANRFLEAYLFKSSFKDKIAPEGFPRKINSKAASK
jgi:hypothetical protein